MIYSFWFTRLLFSCIRFLFLLKNLFPFFFFDFLISCVPFAALMTRAAYFFVRYSILAPNVIPAGFVDGKVVSEKVLGALQLDDNDYRLGHTKVRVFPSHALLFFYIASMHFHVRLSDTPMAGFFQAILYYSSYCIHAFPCRALRYTKSCIFPSCFLYYINACSYVYALELTKILVWSRP